tara:strand:- start:1328 stop:2086 length:759 start_codon:yes stop_codon:yes gene_type:complete
MNMLKPIDFKQSKTGRMVMFYGPPGTGKSTLAARMAKALEEQKKKIAVILDFEIGMSHALQEVDANAKLFDLSDPTPSMAADLISLLKGLRSRDDVAIVILDTLSEMAWSLLQGIAGAKPTTLQIYGERKKALRSILHELRNLTKAGKHVIVLSHQTTGEVEGLPGYYAPECPKNDRSDIVGMFDCVARVQSASKTQASTYDCPSGAPFLNFTRDSQQVSKCRFKIFGDEDNHVLVASSMDDVRAITKKLTP